MRFCATSKGLSNLNQVKMRIGKLITSSRFRVWTGCVLGAFLWLAIRVSNEPTWNGQPLSEWLAAYDSHMRFDEGELIELSRSVEFEHRLLAYEAACFTLPPREIFLPLATRALSEPDAGVRAMATQWLYERFPADAEQVELAASSIGESPR